MPIPKTNLLPSALRVEALAKAAKSAEKAVENFVGAPHVWKNPKATAPKDSGGLRLVSYNIAGGSSFAKAEAALVEHKPDVVCLQEVREKDALALAKRLGMNLVFHQMERGYTRVVGKAILSRYPIVSTENVTYDGSFAGKVETWLKDRKKTEVLESRSLLKATLQIGKRKVDILDTHLSLTEAAANASQLGQIADWIEKNKKAGRPVVLAGDFNTNLALAGRGKADASGKISTVTDTFEEARERYGAKLGNIANPQDRSAANRLLGLMQSYWQAPHRTVLVGGKEITPEQALAELSSGKVSKKSARYRQLLKAMDGISHLTAKKRFDNILATHDVRITEASIDQTAKGSDHQPVIAEVRWD